MGAAQLGCKRILRHRPPHPPGPAECQHKENLAGKGKQRAIGFAPNGAVIQALETTLTSNIDQTVMPAKPLVVGPFYTKNPHVFKADGSTDFSPETGCKS
ncbi:MAG: hypothetical protein ACOH2J_19420 [Allorhizobium sp.]